MPLVDLAVVVGLILVNGFFAMSELAVVSARRGRLQHMADTGIAGARAALRLVDDPAGFLATVQIGITLVGILAGAYSGATLAEPLASVLTDLGWPDASAGTVAFAMVVVGITYLSLTVGELVPKRVALVHAERIATLVGPPMTMISRIGAPIVWLLRTSTDFVLRLLRVGAAQRAAVTEEEVRAMIAEGAALGVFQPAERDLIEGVLRIADEPVRAIMVPRRDIVWLNAEDPPEDIHERVLGHGHSRYLVARGRLDDVYGVVHTKDMLDQVRRTGRLDLDGIVREPVYVGDTMPVLALLDRFRTVPVHLAVVLDEHGALEGLVTPMDILKGIAGHLPEHEGIEEPHAVQRDDGSWLLDGRMPVFAAERTLGLGGMDTGDYETLAGFVLHRLGHLPVIGETFVWSGWRFEVVDMDGRRIDRVLASRDQSGR